MSTLIIECPDSVLRSLHESGEQFAVDLRVLAAVKLYELGKLSSGRAAELAGLSRLMFLRTLGEYGVSLHGGSASDLSADLEAALAVHDHQ